MTGGQLLRPGDTVWLAPRTPSAPAICYARPAVVVVVVRVSTPYVVVRVKGREGPTGPEYEIHEDHILRSDPDRPCAPRGRVPNRELDGQQQLL